MVVGARSLLLFLCFTHVATVPLWEIIEESFQLDITAGPLKIHEEIDIEVSTSAADKDRVTELPGLDGELDFKFYAG
eukprot:775500-Rhodomonas_salina.1